MGYRSDFVLIIHGDDDRGFNPLAKLWVWLHRQAELFPHVGSFNTSWYKFLAEKLEESRSAPHDNYLFFSDDSLKMYEFDQILSRITDYVEEELKLEWEYVRLGEDTEDNEQKSSGDCDTRAWITRSIEVR